MKLRYSVTKSVLLGVTLLLLAAKGAQEIAIDEDFSLVINLPEWLVAFKAVVVPVAATTLAGFVALAAMAHKRLWFTPAIVGYVVVLAYYFLRSAWLESAAQDNLFALLILIACILATALDFGLNRQLRKERNGVAGWMASVSYFCHGYVIATFALLVSGYGYAQVGARFLGLTYHPNAEGALAGLCVGYFMTELRCPQRSLKDRLIKLAFLALSLVLVIASGSRTGALMALMAVLCLIPFRYAIIVLIAAFAAAYIAAGVDLTASDATLGGAVARMLNTASSNRNDVWSKLISDFYEHPILGVGDTSGVSGSSFLTAFAGAGLFGGLVFMVVFAIAAKRSMAEVTGFRRGGGWRSSLLAAVLLLQLMIGALFEGTLFDKFSPFPLLMMISLMAIGDRKSREGQGVGDRA